MNFKIVKINIAPIFASLRITKEFFIVLNVVDDIMYAKIFKFIIKLMDINCCNNSSQTEDHKSTIKHSSKIL